MRYVAAIVLLNLVVITSAAADCAFVPGKVVKGYALHCEDATVWVEAYRAARPKKDPPSTITVYATEKEEHLGTATILVVKVNWELQFAPISTAGGERIHADGPWRQVLEHGRFWLRERPEYCDSLRKPVPVELWVHPPCCDTGSLSGVCPARFDFGEAVTEEVRGWFADVPSPE